MATGGRLWQRGMPGCQWRESLSGRAKQRAARHPDHRRAADRIVLRGPVISINAQVVALAVQEGAIIGEVQLIGQLGHPLNHFGPLDHGVEVLPLATGARLDHSGHIDLTLARVPNLRKGSLSLLYHRDDLDWDVVQRRASQWGWDGGVYLHCAWPATWSALPYLTGFLRSLQPKGFDEGIVAHAREQLFADWQATGSLSPDFARMWGSAGLRDKARTLLRSLFPPARIMSVISPPPDSPRLHLQYGVRFKDSWGRHVRVLWRLAGGNEEVVSLVERRNALREWLELD